MQYGVKRSIQWYRAGWVFYTSALLSHIDLSLPLILTALQTNKAQFPGSILVFPCAFERHWCLSVFWDLLCSCRHHCIYISRLSRACIPTGNAWCCACASNCKRARCNVTAADWYCNLREENKNIRRRSYNKTKIFRYSFKMNCFDTLLITSKQPLIKIKLKTL